MTRHRGEELTIGEDSFLDTVANLVGILIIIVVIVGAGTQSAARHITEKEIAKVGYQGLQQPLNEAKQIEQDLYRHELMQRQHTMEIAYRKAERDAILDRVQLAKHLIEEDKSKLDEPTQEIMEQEIELSELEKKLAELIGSNIEQPNVDPEVIKLQHLPTPMAKTVFNKEIHVLLAAGKLSIVPWDRLVETLKREAELVVRRNTRKENIDGQLGPIAGFMMDYRLVSKRGVVSNGMAMGMASMVELDRFELSPAPDLIRESIDETFSGSGRMRLEMADRRPQETVVTAWVYSDSFQEFRILKERLFSMGFMTAARPLPDGIRIGASPNGSQSAAQ